MLGFKTGVSVVHPVSLFAELKRRRVIRALVGYGIVAFAVLQIIEPVIHGFHWPDAVLSYAVVALAIGFPIVVGLAWIFDMGSAGIERTAPAARLTLKIYWPSLPDGSGLRRYRIRLRPSRPV